MFKLFYRKIRVNNTPKTPRAAKTATTFLGILPLLLMALPNMPNTTGWIKNGMAKIKEIKPADSAPNMPPWIEAKSPKCEIAELLAIAAYSRLIPAKCNMMNPPKTATNYQPSEKSINPLISLLSSLFAFRNVVSAK